jgi:hypothetical protein
VTTPERWAALIVAGLPPLVGADAAAVGELVAVIDARLPPPIDTGGTEARAA